MTIHETLKSRRLASGLSQEELAARAGVSRPTVARLERGDDISLKNLSSISASLGLSVTLSEGQPQRD